MEPPRSTIAPTIEVARQAPSANGGKRMGKTRQLNGRHVVNDLRSGMGDWELQVKYQLSLKGLQRVFEKLVTYQVISQSELCQRSPLYKATTDVTDARKCRTVCLDIPITIYDLETKACGLLRDISESGLRVAGIEADVGQVKTFLIPIDMFMPTDPLLVVAECKWIETKSETKRHSMAGFEMIDLPDKALKTIQDFMEFLVLGDSGEWKTRGRKNISV